MQCESCEMAFITFIAWLKLKILNFSGDFVWHSVATSSQCWESPNFTTSKQCERCWNLPNGHWIKNQNIYRNVWILWSSYNTTLNTTGLSFKHRPWTAEHIWTRAIISSHAKYCLFHMHGSRQYYWCIKKRCGELLLFRCYTVTSTVLRTTKQAQLRC